MAEHFKVRTFKLSLGLNLIPYFGKDETSLPVLPVFGSKYLPKDKTIMFIALDGNLMSTPPKHFKLTCGSCNYITE